MMIEYVTEAIGSSCEQLDDEGRVAAIAAAFEFSDGDRIPMFVEETASGLRFFDEGEVILHLLGRGVRFDTRQDEQFLRNLLEPHGISLSDSGEVEVSCARQDARAVFERYVLAMNSVVQWERDQECVAVK